MLNMLRASRTVKNIELNAQSQPGNSKDIARAFKIATEPEFKVCLNTHGTGVVEKIVRGTQSKFFSKV